MATLILYPDSPREKTVALERPPVRIGRAADSEIAIEAESVSTQHARLERKSDGWYLIDLGSTNGTRVNGSPASFCRLHHGDAITFGSIETRFLLADAELVEGPVEGSVEPVGVEAIPPAGGLGPAALPVLAAGPRCPRCQAALGPGMNVCPYCGAALSILPALASEYVPPVQPPGQAGPGMLPVIAFLASLTVVGFPIAIVLGLMSLSLIRRRGGSVRDRNMALWSSVLGTVWLAVLLAGVGLYLKVRHNRARTETARTDVQENETRVVAALKGLARAQKFARTTEYRDSDGDGNGEYLDMAGLAACGSAFFDADLADGEAYGYRFLMKEATEGDFIAAAEPLTPGATGTRVFAIDKTGQMRGKDIGLLRTHEVGFALPVLQNERGAFYEIDDEIAEDVINVVKALGEDDRSRERKGRILRRLREEYALTKVGQKLQGLEATVDRDLTEYRAQQIYEEAQRHLREGQENAALAKLNEIAGSHAGFSKVAEVKRQILDLETRIAERQEQEARTLFEQAERMERDGRTEEAHRLYQKIEKHCAGTDVAKRIAELKPELQRLLREKNAEEIFMAMMELSPERDFEQILNLAAQLRRNYRDTDQFARGAEPVGQKERKARAYKWRAETLEDIRTGRSRGALARLEAAARDSPDLLYDLRDVFVKLYRDVADKLVAENDFREALRLYATLQKLTQGTEEARQIDADLMARLHNSVGQADFERGAFPAARWHLASAEWKFREDAQFNLRLGVASLYGGLYEPALKALGAAVSLNANMDQAYLYRAYLNTRYLLALEERVGAALYGGAKGTPLPARVETAPAGTAGAASNTVADAAPEEEAALSGEAAAGAGEDAPGWKPGVDFAAHRALGERSPVPPPTDAALRLQYDYEASSRLLSGLIDLIRRLNDAKTTFKKQIDEAKGQRKGSAQDVRMKQYVDISKFRNEVSGYRTLTVEDGLARRQVVAALQDVEARLAQVVQDLGTAARIRKELGAVAGRITGQAERKRKGLAEAVALISGSMQKEVETQNRALQYAEDLLKQVQLGATGGMDVPRLLQDLVQRSGDRQGIDRGFVALRTSIAEQIDLDDILRAAEGVSGQ